MGAATNGDSAARSRRRLLALATLFLLAAADVAAAKKARPYGAVPDACPSEFDDVECESFKRGVADGAADVSVGVPDPFRKDLKDIGQFPYIRGYETGRRKAGGA
jgi:hypothetical protein